MLRPSRPDAAREVHNSFCERFAFWKLRSRESVGPKELRAAALHRLRTSPLPRACNLTPGQRAAAVDRLLSNDAWLTRQYGSLLTRVLEAIEEEVFHGLYGSGPLADMAMRQRTDTEVV